MRHTRISSATGYRLLLHGAGHAGHVVLNEKRIHHRDGKRAEQRACHERAPMVDVAFDELGHNADRDGLDFGRRDERTSQRTGKSLMQALPAVKQQHGDDDNPINNLTPGFRHLDH
jgi:hypothetical protein